MSAKSSRRARIAAWQEAQRLGLWRNGETQVFAGLRGMLRKLFRKSQWLDEVGHWHKATLKTFAKAAATYFRSGQAERDFYERRRFAHIQRKAARIREHDRRVRALEHYKEAQEILQRPNINEKLDR